MIVQFEVLGRTLQFDDSLKLYYQAMEECNKEFSKIWDIFDTSSKLSSYELRSNLKDAVGMLRNPTFAFLGEHMPKSDDIADVFISTTHQFDDFIEEFETQIDIIYDNINETESQWLHKNVENLTRKKNEIIREAENDAARGLGFGILSNSIFAHALYGSMSIRNVKKKEQDCEAELNRITEENAEVISQQLKKFEQEMKYEISILLTNTLNDFKAALPLVLKKWKIISPTCDDGIDEKRSNKIIDNIFYTSDKHSAIFEALTLCPYCRRAYEAAQEQGITDAGLDKLNEFFS